MTLPGKKSFQRYVFLVSDATGKTCRTVVDAALAQFKSTDVVLEPVPQVRTVAQVEELFERAAAVNGIVIYTMVSPELRLEISERGRRYGVPTVDILGPVLTRLSDLLEISPLARPGLFRQLDSRYFSRIEAIDFTIKHDDGANLSTLEQAEVVLLGVSRTTKTPVCIYLSYRGWKAANIPIIDGEKPPAELLALDPRKVVGLTIHPNRLETIRMERKIRLGKAEMLEYTCRDSIRRELLYAARLYEENGYPVVDVTYKSIEETSTEIMRLLYTRLGMKKGNIQEE